MKAKQFLLPVITLFLVAALSACGSGNFLELGESFEESFGTNGRLVYTVKSASVSQSAEDGCFVEDAHVTVDGVSYINPDFITSDGLISGASLVLLELEVQNVDADNAGMYDEPYVFRADSIVTLADLSKKSRGSYSYIDAAYFSLLNGRSEHSMAYELKPGESIKDMTGARKVLTNPYVSTAITVVLGVALGMTGYAKIWALFGAANQLLAALGLLAVAAWLGKIGRNNKMFYFPMAFMLIVTLTSLVFTIKAQIGLITTGADVTWGVIRAVIAVLLIILAIDLVIEGVKALSKQAKAKTAAAE